MEYHLSHDQYVCRSITSLSNSLLNITFSSIMSKLTIFTLAAFVAVAFAQCDWSTVNQEACRQSNTQADCFPDGWPACGGAAYGAGGDGGQAIADILQASCNEV